MQLYPVALYAGSADNNWPEEEWLGELQNTPNFKRFYLVPNMDTAICSLTPLLDTIDTLNFAAEMLGGGGFLIALELNDGSFRSVGDFDFDTLTF